MIRAFNVHVSVIQKRKEDECRVGRLDDIGSDFMTTLIRSDMWLRSVKCQQDHIDPLRKRITSA